MESERSAGTWGLVQETKVYEKRAASTEKLNATGQAYVVPGLAVLIRRDDFAGVDPARKPMLDIEASAFISALDQEDETKGEITFGLRFNDLVQTEWVVPPCGQGRSQPVHGEYTVRKTIPTEGDPYEIALQYGMYPKGKVVSISGERHIVVKAHLIYTDEQKPATTH